MKYNFQNLFNSSGLYSEIRQHQNFNNTIVVIDGSVTENSVSEQGGVCARVYNNGAWGFSANSEADEASAKQCLKWASENAQFLSGKTKKNKIGLTSKSFEVEKDLRTKKPKMTQKQRVEFINEVDNYIQKKYPNLVSRNIRLSSLDFEKTVMTSDFSKAYTFLPRTHMLITLTTESGGQNYTHREIIGGLGEFEDNFTDINSVLAVADQTHKTLLEKTDSVPVKGGEFDVVLGHKITGVLAHEAVGHPLEADLIKMGSVAGQYYDDMIGSEKVNMVDFAHTAFGSTCHVPVFSDDEGTEAIDAPLITNGKLTSYMNNKELAHFFDHKATGNARAFAYMDEPLVRMRNTAILPGDDKLEDMISSIENGYYFTETANGQADLTTEFMFGVPMGYEIKNGQLGKPVIDTTISGLAIDVLKSVDGVADDFLWTSAGFCGKKQRMSVSFGGPSIKCRLKVGGE